MENTKREVKEKYFTIDSDKLIAELIKDDRIVYLGIGDRYKDDSGLNNDKFKSDNTYNWELLDEYEDFNGYYSLSNDFEIRETNDLIVLSKHIGQDIRGGYEDDIIYLKTDKEDYFLTMVFENMHLGIEDDNN